MKTFLLFFMVALTVWTMQPIHAQSNAVRTMTIDKINEELYSLDETAILKLRFEYRSEIKQLSATLGSCNLWDKKGNNIYVEFPTEGMRFFRNLPTASGGHDYYVFVTAAPELLQNKAGATYEGPKLLAHGTTMMQGFSSGSAPTYKW
ncbi:MAG: hypothetical protein B9S32_13805 [Verrucomicrobia bacterium Tous-C9LFEB]|nr:MAG: hypothetical protein B9S32_13805 [Verrucomicrobia bacterium Tous-C9LFEB]